MNINSLLKKVKHKESNKGTTTLSFKRDLYDAIIMSEFEGDILEIGTNAGDTTVILSEAARIKKKMVYSFDINTNNIRIAKNKLTNFGYSNFKIIKKDVYNSKWDLNNIGCVFIDCVHTESAFESDINNAISVCNSHPLIFVHDYGLCDGGIKSFLNKNRDKFKIVRFMGEQKDWNKNGTSEVNDWEGVQIKFYET